MATEFDPVTGKPVTGDPTLRNDPMIDERRSGMGTIGLLAALAFAVVLGLMFWNMADNNTTASNPSPGVTTGSTTTSPTAPAPAPTAPPPASGGTTTR
jgi:hypothetical protein